MEHGILVVSEGTRSFFKGLNLQGQSRDSAYIPQCLKALSRLVWSDNPSNADEEFTGC